MQFPRHIYILRPARVNVINIHVVLSLFTLVSYHSCYPDLYENDRMTQRLVLAIFKFWTSKFCSQNGWILLGITRQQWEYYDIGFQENLLHVDSTTETLVIAIIMKNSPFKVYGLAPQCV